MGSLSFTSSIGPITLTEEGGRVTRLEFTSSKTSHPSAVLRKCEKEITEYLGGKRKMFTIPFQGKGTPFDRKVWTAMEKVVFGKTVSYGDLARAIGKPKAFRAVANACGRNPLAILVPCHRIVAAHGIGGYNSGITRKKALLNIEGYLGKADEAMIQTTDKGRI